MSFEELFFSDVEHWDFFSIQHLAVARPSVAQPLAIYVFMFNNLKLEFYLNEGGGSWPSRIFNFVVMKGDNTVAPYKKRSIVRNEKVKSEIFKEENNINVKNIVIWYCNNIFY